MFIPSKRVLLAYPEIQEWLTELEQDIKGIFKSLEGRGVITCSREQGALKEFVTLQFEYQEVNEINDFVYKEILRG